jgi:hypothetical protein
MDLEAEREVEDLAAACARLTPSQRRWVARMIEHEIESQPQGEMVDAAGRFAAKRTTGSRGVEPRRRSSGGGVTHE